jgi:type II restriction enzyme
VVSPDPLAAAIDGLTHHQREFVGRIVGALTTPVAAWRNPRSDVATEQFVELMSDVLRGHHISSSKALGKEHFEHALAGILVELKHDAELSPMTFAGADLKVDGIPWSLKTQADMAIKDDLIHVSKFMELGKGRWEDEGDLAALRDRMLVHMKGYQRIFTLRHLSGARSRRETGEHHYELVEIPKALLEEASGRRCVMTLKSSQTPKPGTCTVRRKDGTVAFELYFDGGTERKLQVRKLRKDLCVLHATWRFHTPD